MNKKIILFIGRKGCGKDTCCKMLQDIRPAVYHQVSFAESLRNTVWELFGKKIGNRERLWGAIDKKEAPIDGWVIPESYGFKEKYWTGRRLLQWFGTDICRTVYDTIWVDKALEEISKHENVIITDCRFRNEFDAIVQHFDNSRLVFPVAVDRPTSENGYSAHASEADIPALMKKCHWKIDNNSTLVDLEEKVCNVDEFLAFYWLMK